MKGHKLLIGLIIPLLMSSCATVEELHVIGDIAYDAGKTRNNLVYLNEQHGYIPYIVLTNNYNGNTLLLREDALPIPKRINDYNSFYENSEIDAFLNNEFIDYLENKNLVLISELEIADNDSIGYSGEEIRTIARKVFLLSCNEVALDMKVNTAKEGKALDYFMKADHRIALKDGQPTSWWLRSPNTYYVSCTYGIGSDGKIGFGNSSDYSGIRPAFCISSSTEIKQSNDIVPGQSVFTITN